MTFVPDDSFIPGSFNNGHSYLLTANDNADDIPPVVDGTMNPGYSSIQGELTNDPQNSSQSSNILGESIDRISINDLFSGESYNFTTTTLLRCKEKVLRPYWRLLVFIGWRGFARESVMMNSWKWRALNIAYPVFISLLLWYTYAYEMVACQWKLNVHNDINAMSTTTSPVPTTHNSSSATGISFISINPAMYILNQSLLHPQPCEHVITTYIIPNILHFIAYIMGLVYFRIQDSEQLYALMEKVFLQATPLHSKTASQKKMVNKLRCFLSVGAVWVTITLILQGLYVWAFNFPDLALFKTMLPFTYWLLFSIGLLGRIVLNSVILAVVVNYATQCEVLLFYIRGITLRLQEKCTDLKTAMQDILQLKQSLGWLNGAVSKMTSLVMIILAELTVIGITILCLNKYSNTTVWVYRGIFPFVWLCIFTFPLFQAARVNSMCKRLLKISLEIRVFGYKNNPQLDLDSFLQFVSCVKLKARMFHIPVQSSYIIAIIVLTTFILLILFQTSIIGPRDVFF